VPGGHAVSPRSDDRDDRDYWVDRLEGLRQSFDHGFAAATRPEPTAGEAVLEIRIAAARYLLRLAEVGGVFVDRKIVRMPSRAPEFLGIAGLRGAMTPVYDLGLLLGQAPSPPSRWFVMGAERLVGFAFDGLEGHHRVSRAELISAERRGSPQSAAGKAASSASSTSSASSSLEGRTAGDAARIGDRWLPIVNLGVLSERIRKSARPLMYEKER
jgi:chemotaxis signal transduction protein